jgi:threonine synthase
MTDASVFRCLKGCGTFPLDEPLYACRTCGGLLEVAHRPGLLGSRDAAAWKRLFDGRPGGVPGPDGSGVWRFHEWVLPSLPRADIVTLGEGATPLTGARRLSEAWGIELLIKQCGHSLSGSFKDLGMTVLMSQVHHMRHHRPVPAVACASTGDTSAALAAYGAAAGIRTLVLLPRGKISAAQLAQPLAHGARVLAIDTDFDGCMGHVQRLADEEGVYLANSKNSLRLEGQKTVALEIAQGLGWSLPDWVCIPGGNLGNVSALGSGFGMLREAGVTDRLPRLLCAQVAQADPLYRSYKAGYAPLTPVAAGTTQASAIQIGNPVSFPRAVRALQAADGVVESISEAELAQVAREADTSGLYVCPHTAVALAGVHKGLQAGIIPRGARVVVVSTAHGLKFTEFKVAVASDGVAGAHLGSRIVPREVADDYAAIKDAALGA